VIFPFVLAAMVVAPVLAIGWSARDHQLMAPAVGGLDTTTRVARDALLRGEPVGARTLWPLVRVEGWRLFRHPAPYLVALPLCALSLWSLSFSPVTFYGRDDVELIVFLVPLAWGTLIASNLLTLRSRRWHAEELLATMPVPARSRTLAHLLACLVMVPVALAMLAVPLGFAARSGRAFGTPRPWVLVTAVLIVVGGGFVGVAVARWLPRPVMGWVAVVATLVLQLNGGHLDPQWRWLHFSMYANEAIAYPELAPDRHLLHVVYLVGGLVLVAAVALARDGLDARAGALLAASGAVLVLAGALQVQPASVTDASILAGRLQDPASGQVCTSDEGVILCTDPAYADLVPHWRATVAGVARRLPTTARTEPLVLRQRPTIEARTALPPEVAERVDPALAWPDDDEVSLSSRWALPGTTDDTLPGRFQLALAFRTASTHLGLPPDAWWSAPSIGSTAFVTVPLAAVGDEIDTPLLGPLVQCTTEGEARGAAAVWLAGQATPAARAELAALAGRIVGYDQLHTPVAFDPIDNYGALLPSTIPEQGAVPSGADIVAATALLTRDDAEVAAVLAAHWPTLVGPGPGGRAATTAELLSWFGMDAERAADVVRSTAPPADPDPHPEDVPRAPAITGPCPLSRP
jgi:hypothetical protein